MGGFFFFAGFSVFWYEVAAQLAGASPVGERWAKIRILKIDFGAFSFCEISFSVKKNEMLDTAAQL